MCERASDIARLWKSPLPSTGRSRVIDTNDNYQCPTRSFAREENTESYVHTATTLYVRRYTSICRVAVADSSAPLIHSFMDLCLHGSSHRTLGPLWGRNSWKLFDTQYHRYPFFLFGNPGERGKILRGSLFFIHSIRVTIKRDTCVFVQLMIILTFRFLYLVFVW